MTSRLLSIAALAMATTACASGPDYVAPATPASAIAPFVQAQGSALVTAGAPAGDWWRLYDDPVLDELVRDALAANTDVRVAVARLAKARAGLREERGSREPQVGVGASADYGRAQPVAGNEVADLNLGGSLDIAYDLDLFGRVGRRVEAASGEVGAAAADADAVRVLIVADTVAAYADAVSAADRMTVAQRIVDLLDRSYALTKRRHEVGLANGLDTARIATLRDQRRAEIPLLAEERQRALLRLATLTGRTPRDLPPTAATRLTSLGLSQPIPVGDGATLLARRPDVRAAERRLAASTARIGVATADLYPRITLGGSLGASGNGISNLLSNPLGFLVGPLISWTANRTAARARVAGAEADMQAALATFDGTLLGAIEETEAALSAYREALSRRDALNDAAAQADRAVAITRARQREGDISSLELLDAERTAADTEATLAAANAAIARAQIDLFRSLGGTWSN